jgi:hypothetical protein
MKPEIATAIVTVGDGGRGFIVAGERRDKVVITCAHCLPDRPPSTTSACPTTKLAPGLHSQSTTDAISSGLPIRPIGKDFDKASNSFSSSNAVRANAVSVVPGRPRSPDAFSGVFESRGSRQTDDTVLRRSIGRNTPIASDATNGGTVDDCTTALAVHLAQLCFMQLQTPRRLTRVTRSNSSSVLAAVGASLAITPALLKAASSRPNSTTAECSQSPPRQSGK